jgi:hypothetical protein
VHESPVPAFRLDAAGYETSESLTRDIPVAVSGVWDEKVEAYAAGGGTVLLLSSDAKHLSKLGLGVTEPRGQMGSNQTYWYVNLEKGLFKRIPFENPMGWTFYRMMRRGTPILTGLDQSAGDDVLVNCYAVWLRSCDFSPGASGLTGFIVQLKYGNGRVVVATPDFKESMMYDDDPVAAIMFDDLIQYCFTDFRPLGC